MNRVALIVTLSIIAVAGITILILWLTGVLFKKKSEPSTSFPATDGFMFDPRIENYVLPTLVDDYVNKIVLSADDKALLTSAGITETEYRDRLKAILKSTVTPDGNTGFDASDFHAEANTGNFIQKLLTEIKKDINTNLSYGFMKIISLLMEKRFPGQLLYDWDYDKTKSCAGGNEECANSFKSLKYTAGKDSKLMDLNTLKDEFTKNFNTILTHFAGPSS